jgi:hypothetical protein
VSDTLQWKRHINTLRYLYRELELVEEVAEIATPKFLKYYSDFCKERDLNPQHGPPGTNLEEEKKVDILPEVSGSLTTTGGSKEYHNDQFGNLHLLEDPDAEVPNDLHKIFTKVFRALAPHLHPDTIPSNVSEAERAERIKLFRKSLAALEEKHYFRLITMAERFGIETPEMSDEQVEWLSREIRQVRGKLSQIQGTYNYHFSECKTEQQRENLLRSFLMQNFNIEV